MGAEKAGGLGNGSFGNNTIGETIIVVIVGATAQSTGNGKDGTGTVEIEEENFAGGRKSVLADETGRDVIQRVRGDTGGNDCLAAGKLLGGKRLKKFGYLV